MTGFPGFSPAAVAFLRDLKANNNRDWFQEHKPVYDEEIRIPAGHFCAAMTAELEDLTGLPHDARIFRVHRDIRFSRDKTPYKPHLHILFSPSGREAPPAWFFGLESGRMALGAGRFEFTKAQLDEYRNRVAADDAVGAVADVLRADGIRLNEPQLKRVPSGYPSDHPRADLLRRKGLHAWIEHPDPMAATSPDLVPACRRDFERLRPLFDLLLALT